VSSPRPLILLAEEDDATRAFLVEQLDADGYEIVEAHSRQHAQALLASSEPDLVLADVNGETLRLLDAIRGGEGLGGRVNPDTPMIVLTGRDELARVRALEHGGDDVVTKPFSYPELRARIAAVLRRAYDHGHRQVVRVGNLRVDLAGREARVDERPVALSAREFDLLRALASDPMRVLTREELLRDVWHYAPSSRSRTVDSHAHRLRRKLADAGADRPLVVTVWGVGWRLCDHAPAARTA
jgi:DNA-binding response OmpR family regulator